MKLKNKLKNKKNKDMLSQITTIILYNIIYYNTKLNISCFITLYITSIYITSIIQIFIHLNFI